LRSYRIYKHIIGTPAESDELVYEEKDETFSCYVSKSKSDEYIFIESSQTLSSEVRFLSANDVNGKWKIVQPRERNHEYSVSHFGDDFYIITNDKARNFRLMKTPVNKTEKTNWKEIIAHRSETFLEGIEIFKDFFVLEERTKGLTNIRIKSWTSEDEHYIEFNDPAYMAYTSSNPEYTTDVVRFGYTSLTTPNSVFDYNMKTREKQLLKQTKVLDDNFSPDNYVSERHYATARDGVQVPISLVYKKGMEMNGTNPVLLYGYGSYGNNIDPYFSSVRLSLLDRGFVFAIAHIRGGQELGREWYEDGKLFKKKNTFSDFIDCGEYLIEKGFTKPAHLYAQGGSAGGLLMGAAMNMRPDLWNGVIAGVPFVDVISTMWDETIPLTTGEFDEWGNPKDKEYYDYMLSYSPYDNIEKKEYPNTLITTGYWDSQVQYWEPAKWIAKLRANKTDNNLLMMYCNMDVGHGGASGRFERFKEVALEYAFLLSLEGITK
jgi:oligopeptidase B